MYFNDGEIDPKDPAKRVHIGWLDREHEFPRGVVPRPFFEKLVQFGSNPVEPFVSAGSHECDLHQFTRGPSQLSYGTSSISGLFRTNLFIPDGTRIFYAPSAIVHYIDAFFYCPPAAFIDAVMHCPPMRSIEYKKLFLASGGRSLIKA